MATPIWERVSVRKLLRLTLIGATITGLVFGAGLATGTVVHVDDTKTVIVTNESGDAKHVLENGLHLINPLNESAAHLPHSTTTTKEHGIAGKNDTALYVTYHVTATVTRENALEFYATYGSDTERATRVYEGMCVRSAIRNATKTHTAEDLLTDSRIQEVYSTCDNEMFNVMVERVEYGYWESSDSASDSSQSHPEPIIPPLPTPL